MSHNFDTIQLMIQKGQKRKKKKGTNHKNTTLINRLFNKDKKKKKNTNHKNTTPIIYFPSNLEQSEPSQSF